MSKEDLENIETILQSQLKQHNGDAVLQRGTGGTFNLHGLLTKVRRELGLLSEAKSATR